MKKYKAKIGKNVTNNSYYPDYICIYVGKTIFLRKSVNGMYFGYLPKDNMKVEYCFDSEDLIGLEEITET